MPADFVVVNTCTVTSVADRKSRQVVRQFKKYSPTTKVIVMGCGPQVQFDRYQKMSASDFVVRNAEDVIELLRDQSKEELAQSIDGISVDATLQKQLRLDTERTRSLIKIQNGCNEFCSYCIVPMTRGRSVSLSKEEILGEILEKEAAGMAEAVITGINIGDFDIVNDKSGLPQLLEYILKNTSTIRFRLSSLNPNYFDRDFYNVLQHPRICRHIHLSIQSGADAVLERMRRKYNQEKILEVAQEVYKIDPDFAFTGDAIMGFPEETEEDFFETKKVAEAVKFAHLHVFPYSPREGTLAEKYKRVDPQIAKERARLMREFSLESQKQFIERNIGKVKKVLVEKQDDFGEATGLSDNYIRVKFENADEVTDGDIIDVLLTKDNVCGVG